MPRALLLVLLVCFGCATAEDSAGPDLHPVIGIDPDVADLALSAIALWQGATGGQYAPAVHLGCLESDTICLRETDGMVDQCGETGSFRGCYGRGEMQVSEAMAYDQKISTVAHELGHALGLEHGAAGLMNPHRPVAERHTACVDAVTLDQLASLGVEGEFSARCYGDDVRAEALSMLDAL